MWCWWRRPHHRECLTTIGRLVDAAAPRRALAVVRFAGAHPHEIGVDLRHGHITDRDQPLILKERREERAVTGGLPHAAVGRTHVPDGRIGFVDGEVGNAPRHRGGPDGAEVQLIKLLRVHRDGCTQERERRQQGGTAVQCPGHGRIQREEGSGSPRGLNRSTVR